MKKVIAIMAVLAIAAPVMAFHGEPEWQNDDYDCSSCHIPHTNSNVGSDAAGDPLYGEGNLSGVPLWSGYDFTDEDDYDPATWSWTMYSSPTLDAVVPGAPIGATLLCMACHDRVHGVKGYGINSSAGQLNTTHPVDFVYDSALATADGELVDPTTPGSSGLTRGTGTLSIEEDLLYTADGVAGKVVNCISCHEIHQNGLHGVSVSGSTPDPASTSENPLPDIPYEHDLHIPRLQPLVNGPHPIGYYLSRRGDESIEDDWE